MFSVSILTGSSLKIVLLLLCSSCFSQAGSEEPGKAAANRERTAVHLRHAGSLVGRLSASIRECAGRR